MGTNFYWRDQLCASCGRHDQAHVGKRSGGWSFGFRAYPHRLFNAEHPDWGYDPRSPFGFPVESRADWRRVFTERPGELWDEYGGQVNNPVAWLDGLDPPTPEKQQWEDSPEALGRFWQYGLDQRHRDAEGFRFYSGEFS